MNLEVIAPHFLLVLGSLLLPLLPRVFRSPLSVLFPAVAFVLLWYLPEGESATSEFFGYTLIWLKVDRLSRIFAAIFLLIVTIGGVYAYHLRDTGQQSAALLYGASAAGVALAGDFVSLFIWWEVMAIASSYLVWAQRDRESKGAGMRYLLMHLFGGSLLLAGILLHLFSGGEFGLHRFSDHTTLGSWLILLGVLLNAAAPPLHAWLIDSYTRATVTGSVFLSALTTKAAVYVLARIFPGWDILLGVGIVMALYGIAFAVLSNDTRELLAYHIVSQVGYMVAGVGLGTEMGINGATALAVSNILYKALLFMGAGAVLHATGKSKLAELGGLFKVMPTAFALYMIGAFSISGFPPFNGFVSKSMVISAFAEVHHGTAVLLLSLASIGTFLHTGLKLPYFTWFGEKRNLQPAPVPRTMYIGMGLASFLCVYIGIVPGALYRFLPFPVTYEPYTWGHLTETAELLLFTFVAFWLFRGMLAGTRNITLDVDWFYRRPGRWLGNKILSSFQTLFAQSDVYLQDIINPLVRFAKNPAAVRENLFPSGAAKPAIGEDYDPDRSRIPLGLLLTIVIGSLLGLMIVAFFF